nr:site-specific DNA-methyltransferase [Brevibacterium daeguense]
MRGAECGLPRDRHIAIEGENLEALHLLRRTHREQVKVVYLDPPYNTGSTLPYRDTFGAAGHSGWLNMMLPRLLLTRELLRDDGVVFISIDDRENAHLQLLGHEVFGEENYLGSFVQQRAKGGGNARSFVRGHDFVLVWARNAQAVGPFLTEKRPPAKYETIGDRRFLVDDDVLRVSFGKYTRGAERRLMYEDILAVRGPAKKAEVDAGLAAGTLRLRPWGDPAPDGARKHAVVRLTPAEDASSKMYSIIKALNEGGRRDLEALGLGGLFGYPKPLELIRTLVRSQTFFDREAIVLDFFAGSGTTGQAVMELNAADGGDRRFVLVQQPEELRDVPGARTGAEAAGASEAGGASGEGGAITTISELMRERVRRAGEALRSDHPELDVEFVDVRLPPPDA